MKHMVAICAIAAFLLGNIVALAATKTILQKGKVFSETEVVIAKGDTLTFVNNDTVTHNVMSKSPGNEFNIGAQPPGVSAPVYVRRSWNREHYLCHSPANADECPN